MPTDAADVLLRLLVAFALSTAFGIARQVLGKAIGFGTFIFVAVGSCGLAALAVLYHPDNPLPLLAATVTGIGFLGAGALFRTSDRMVGFTSAATIWIFAVFGLAVGVGAYVIGATIYGMVWIVIAIDRQMERRWFGVHQRRLCVETSLDVEERELRGALGLPARLEAQSLKIDRTEGRQTVTYLINRRRTSIDDVLCRLRDHAAVQTYHLE